MPFGFFKKKKEVEPVPHYDPTNIKITDLRKGFLLDFDFTTWEVTEEYEYDWGDDHYSYEYKLESTKDHFFLSIEEDDELVVTVFRKINFGLLDASVEDALMKEHRPPRKIEYDGKIYYRDGEYPGYCREIDDKRWEEFISWMYFDEAGEYALGIEQWGETDFSAALGKVESPLAFSNILPVQR